MLSVLWCLTRPDSHHISGRQHYRLYTIHRIPTLKVLDFTKVKQTERDRAERLATSAAGAALQGDIQQEAAKTFMPGESLDEAKAVMISYTAEQKEAIRQLLANASSAKELEEIEAAVRRGVLPEALQHGHKRKRENGGDQQAVEAS